MKNKIAGLLLVTACLGAWVNETQLASFAYDKGLVCRGAFRSRMAETAITGFSIPPTPRRRLLFLGIGGSAASGAVDLIFGTKPKKSVKRVSVKDLDAKLNQARIATNVALGLIGQNAKSIEELSANVEYAAELSRQMAITVEDLSANTRETFLEQDAFNRQVSAWTDHMAAEHTRQVKLTTVGYVNIIGYVKAADAYFNQLNLQRADSLSIRSRNVEYYASLGCPGFVDRTIGEPKHYAVSFLPDLFTETLANGNVAFQTETWIYKVTTRWASSAILREGPTPDDVLVDIEWIGKLGGQWENPSFTYSGTFCPWQTDVDPDPFIVQIECQSDYLITDGQYIPAQNGVRLVPSPRDDLGELDPLTGETTKSKEGLRMHERGNVLDSGEDYNYNGVLPDKKVEDVFAYDTPRDYLRGERKIATSGSPNIEIRFPLIMPVVAIDYGWDPGSGVCTVGAPFCNPETRYRLEPESSRYADQVEGWVDGATLTFDPVNFVLDRLNLTAYPPPTSTERAYMDYKGDDFLDLCPEAQEVYTVYSSPPFYVNANGSSSIASDLSVSRGGAGFDMSGDCHDNNGTTFCCDIDVVLPRTRIKWAPYEGGDLVRPLSPQLNVASSPISGLWYEPLNISDSNLTSIIDGLAAVAASANQIGIDAAANFAAAQDAINTQTIRVATVEVSLAGTSGLLGDVFSALEDGFESLPGDPLDNFVEFLSDGVDAIAAGGAAVLETIEEVAEEAADLAEEALDKVDNLANKAFDIANPASWFAGIGNMLIGGLAIGGVVFIGYRILMASGKSSRGPGVIQLSSQT